MSHIWSFVYLVDSHNKISNFTSRYYILLHMRLNALYLYKHFKCLNFVAFQFIEWR